MKVETNLKHTPLAAPQLEGYTYYVVEKSDNRYFDVGTIWFVGNDPTRNLQLFRVGTNKWSENYDRVTFRKLESGEGFTLTV